MCGEKQLRQAIAVQHIGSPPHVRGKVVAEAGHHQIGGITPACAGKRNACSSSASGPPDHPRMCGEKLSSGAGFASVPGSPPYVRGKDPVLYLRQCLQVRPDHARHLVHLSFLRA